MNEFKFSRPNNFPPVIKYLIAINVVVWLAQLVFDKQYGDISTGNLWLTDKLALYSIGSPDFKIYQVLTHMFTHASYGLNGGIQFSHILFNMFALWTFGKTLENVWGPERFLNFYLLSGIGAAAVHLIVQLLAGGYGMAVGASGAVMGVLVGFAYLFPNTELYILFIPFPIKAKWAVIGYVLIDLFGGVASVSGDNIAHFAHLGGALTGFLLVRFWNKNNRRGFY